MENPVEREAKFEDRMNRMQTNCRRIQKDWATPNKTDGYWQEPATKQAKGEFKDQERGYVKTSHKMGTPGSSDAMAAMLEFYGKEK